MYHYTTYERLQSRELRETIFLTSDIERQAACRNALHTLAEYNNLRNITLKARCVAKIMFNFEFDNSKIGD